MQNGVNSQRNGLYFRRFLTFSFVLERFFWGRFSLRPQDVVYILCTTTICCGFAFFDAGAISSDHKEHKKRNEANSISRLRRRHHFFRANSWLERSSLWVEYKGHVRIGCFGVDSRVFYFAPFCFCEVHFTSSFRGYISPYHSQRGLHCGEG